MPLQNIDIIPLIVALVGAGVGAYFAIVKSKKERLWLERFEALKSLINGVELIRHEAEMSELESLGLRVMSDTERASLEAELLQAKSKIRTSISTLYLLFIKDDIEPIRSAYKEMNDSIVGLRNLLPHEYPPNFYLTLRERSEKLLAAVSSLAQSKCI